MRNKPFCRYVPGFNGSPAWMSLKEARLRLRRDTEYVNKMIDIMDEMGDQKGREYWMARYPHIEQAK